MILKSSQQTMKRAAAIVARGGVIAFRTDTFYGLGANPCDAAAVRRIKELKGREDSKPILLVISHRDQVERFIERPSKDFDRLAERFWPGPLTLIGTAHPQVPAEITAGTRTVGIRLPNDEDVRNLVRGCGGALTATSANPSRLNPARNAQEVIDYFPSGIDLIIDGGQSRTDQPSSVVDVSGAGFRLVREGAISTEELMVRHAD
ncbi:MAG: L-threonylcarbamoyladenylate synthase [Pyrinomonadaceae bacterium]